MKNLSQEEMVAISGGNTVDKEKERSTHDGFIDAISSSISIVGGWVASLFK